MDIVEWLVSMLAVRLFVGSSLTISCGLTCRGYIFDRIAFNVVYFFKTFGFRFMVYI